MKGFNWYLGYLAGMGVEYLIYHSASMLTIILASLVVGFVLASLEQRSFRK